MSSIHRPIDKTVSSAHSGLLALTVAVSAGMHAALVPEHLREMPPLGYLFIVAAGIGAAIAAALVVRPSDLRIPRLAALFLLTQVIVWAVFTVARVPGFSGTPEPVEAIAVVCKAVELLGIALAMLLIAGADSAKVRRRTLRRLTVPGVLPRVLRRVPERQAGDEADGRGRSPRPEGGARGLDGTSPAQ